MQPGLVSAVGGRPPCAAQLQGLVGEWGLYGTPQQPRGIGFGGVCLQLKICLCLCQGCRAEQAAAECLGPLREDWGLSAAPSGSAASWRGHCKA